MTYAVPIVSFETHDTIGSTYVIISRPDNDIHGSKRVSHTVQITRIDPGVSNVLRLSMTYAIREMLCVPHDTRGSKRVIMQ